MQYIDPKVLKNPMGQLADRRKALVGGKDQSADRWLEHTGLAALAAEGAAKLQDGGDANRVDAIFDSLESRLVERWESEAGLETYGDAVAEVLELRASEGECSADALRAGIVSRFTRALRA